MPTTVSRRMLPVLLILVAFLIPPTIGATPVAAPSKPHTTKAILFAADGLRQDLVAKYADQGVMPTMRGFLKNGAWAADNGLLTQAATNTGAGWYTLATGAWPGVNGSTNNTFHINGQAFGNSTSAFSANVPQAESIAQAAERGGKRVAQVEFSGGAQMAINGPTVDYRRFLSGRGVATNYIAATDIADLTASFGLQFDHPAGFGTIPAFAAAAPTPATGWTNVPTSYSPAMEMRLRVLDFGTDKYGLNAYIFDSTNNNSITYDKVLFAPTKNGNDKVAILSRGQMADVKVTISGGAFDGKTAGFYVKVEELTPDLSKVRLFHTSVSRAIATWVNWPGAPGFSGDFEEYLAQKFPSATGADFAVVEAGIVSEETYVQQAHQWKAAYHPIMKYVVDTYKPDLLLAGFSETDEFQHQFLGLVTKTLPGNKPNPAYDDVELNHQPDGRVQAREAFIRDAYKGADETLTNARKLMGGNPTTFVASDHGFGTQFLAIDASKPLVDLGLLSKPQTSNCRPAVGETLGKAKACWAGGTVQIYLNLAGRDPAGGGFQQVPAASEAATVAQIRAAYQALSDSSDWSGDGNPEGWKLIDRTFTKAEARYIPNGANSTADMAHPTRTGDLVVFAYPPYQFDGAAPGTLVSLSHFFGQHGYVPDVQDLKANINMRATFLAGGTAIDDGKVTGARSIDLAPTLAYMLRIPLPQQNQGRVLKEILTDDDSKPLTIIGLNDFHGQLDQTTLTMDGLNVPVGGAAHLATLFDEDAAALPKNALLLAGGDNVGASPPNSALLQDMPTIDVENAWGLDATSYGNHEFDYGVERLLQHQERANFPFLGVNIVETATGQPPSWVQGSEVFTVNGLKVGVIGAELQNTPELVSAGATAGLTFLAEVPRIRAESERLRKLGVKIQILLIHQGTNVGTNKIDNVAAVPWEGPIVDYASQLQDTTIDAIVAGHTHRVSNLMVGRILVTEGINAGATYSVLQLMVNDDSDDVEWAGGATRVAKNLGVAKRPDVQAIIDDANAETAVLRNQVIGTQQFDIKRDPTRLHESAMGNLVADAMRLKYPGVDAALTNSGGLRADINCTPPSASEAACEVTWGEMFAVLPFGNRTVIETVTGDQLKSAFLNGFTPFCFVGFPGGTGRFPQISGLKVQFHCDGQTPVVDGIWKAPNGPSGTLTPVGAADTVRLVTNDFMFNGSDGYTALTGGTNVLQPGDALLDVAIEYVTDHSPVGPVVDGRIVGP